MESIHGVKYSIHAVVQRLSMEPAVGSHGYVCFCAQKIFRRKGSALASTHTRAPPAKQRAPPPLQLTYVGNTMRGHAPAYTENKASRTIHGSPSTANLLHQPSSRGWARCSAQLALDCVGHPQPLLATAFLRTVGGDIERGVPPISRSRNTTPYPPCNPRNTSVLPGPL